MQSNNVLNNLGPLFYHSRPIVVTLKGFKCTKDNFEDFVNKLKYVHETKDKSWADSSDSESEVDTDNDSESHYDMANQIMPIDDDWIDYNLREIELRRVLLYRVGKYELEEGELLCVGDKVYYD